MDKSMLFGFQLHQGSPKFLSEGHTSYYAIVRAPLILRHVIRYMLHSTKSTHFSYRFCFFVIDKMYLWPDEMASRAGFGPRAVVWRSLIYTNSIHLSAKLFHAHLLGD